MKKILFLTLLIIFSMDVSILKGVEKGNVKNVKEESIVELDRKITAASKHLSKFFKGDWNYYNHLIYYDFNYQPKVYAIIFIKRNHEAQTLEEIEGMIEKNHSEIKVIKENIESISKNVQLSETERNNLLKQNYKKVTALEDLKEGKNYFATVLTGAVDSLPAILKCYKGLPKELLNKPYVKDILEKDFPGKQFELGKFFYVGLFDILYEVSSESNASTSNSVLSTGYKRQFFHLREKKIVNLRDVKGRITEFGSKEYYEEDKKIRQTNQKKKVKMTGQKAVKEDKNEEK